MPHATDTPVAARCFAAIAVVCTLARVAAGDDALPGKELEARTGALTRVVWLQDQSAAGSDSLALGRELKLMGYDSRDGKGERAILDTARSYAKPLITPTGNRVVYSDHTAESAFVVNWDGTGKRLLGEGFAVEVWRDPHDGVEWVYLCKRVGKLNSIVYRDVRRVKLDQVKASEKVWDKTNISPDNFQLSANGLRVGGEFPWPNGGIAELSSKKFTKLSEGCWCSFAPDDSGLCWVFDGPHRHLIMHRPESADASAAKLGPASPWKVAINGAPGIDGYEMFHPRWSNHVRFFSLTGPYKVQGPGNKITGGGPQVEVFLGRFNEDFTEVAEWVQITHNNRGDFFPDVWIDGGERVRSALPQASPVMESTASWPEATAGLVFIWENAAKQNAVPNEASTGDARSCRVEAHGLSRLGRNFEMILDRGRFLAEQLDQPLADACRASGEFVLSAYLTAEQIDSASPSTIITSASIKGPANFALTQVRNKLLFRIATTKSAADVELCTLKRGQPLHLTVVFQGGSLRYYVDGEPAGKPTATGGALTNWTAQPLVFGADGSGAKNWSGRLEGVALYSRAIAAAAIKRDYQSLARRMNQRSAPARLVIRAKRMQVSAVPEPAAILPYRRALGVHHYRIEKVVEGTLDAREILVAQWAILDGKLLPEARPKAGETVELQLERLADHPELDRERQVQDVEALDLPAFLDVSPPKPPQPIPMTPPGGKR